MNFIGSIEGMNFSPIAGYNNFLKGQNAFEIDADGGFEKILAQQTSAINESISPIKGGVEINTDFNGFFVEKATEAASGKSSTDDFMTKVGKSFSSGLNSVDETVKSAERAQEALAMGEDISVHDVMIAAEKSALSMQMAIQLRNKIVTAYNEINNVRV